MTPPAEKPPSSSFEGDFAPGEILIGRYRVVALVGEGGMGQVYLADDLVLGEPVAVKFLPRDVAEREGGLERFRAEVRHARQVTHPNVARVHDIGEVDGRHFLTMEFVDGEDLASLIKRIGRLPGEKAAEIGRQVCSGLAEAHRQGVLHRDLKPANVMLDGEGRVRLTDFGLAAATGSEAATAGTPQYMAPEQLSGVPATVQSEVYSLGLLLYELYTGQRALRGRTLDQLRREHEEGGPSAPSTHLSHLDPTVEAVLTRCLARDPAERPRSVSEVAAALPGGDPLAAAIAAGETPAPHLVAAARASGLPTPGQAALLTAAAALSFVLVTLAVSWTWSHQGSPYGRPSAYLRERAREVASELSGQADFAYEVHWHEYDADVAELRELAREEGADLEPPLPLVHHSRFGSRSFTPTGYYVGRTDPAPYAGSMHLVLDGDGRLLSWTHWIEEVSAGTEVERGAAEELFELAGLSSSAFDPVEPDDVPPVYSTSRATWRLRSSEPPSGTNDTEPQDLRVVAAWVGSRPVEFGLLLGPQRLGTYGAPASAPIELNVFLLVVLAAAAGFALLNVRAGRGDVRGSLVVGGYTLAMHIVLSLGYPSPGSADGFGTLLMTNLGASIQMAVLVALLYLSLEPFARRNSPRVLIGWSRLLEGRYRDPAVGREVLVGILAGPLVVGLGLSIALGCKQLGLNTSLLLGTRSFPIFGLEGPLIAMCHLLHFSSDAVLFGGSTVFSLVGLRWLLPSRWLANALWLAVMVPLIGLTAGLVMTAVLLLAILFTLERVGFLSVAATIFAYLVLSAMPLTLDTGDWYFSSTLVVLLVFAFLLAWSCWSVVGEQIASPAAASATAGTRRDLT